MKNVIQGLMEKDSSAVATSGIQDEKEPPIIRAVRNKDLATLKELVGTGEPKIINATNKNGETAFNIAIGLPKSALRTQIVKLLTPQDTEEVTDSDNEAEIDPGHLDSDTFQPSEQDLTALLQYGVFGAFTAFPSSSNPLFEDRKEPALHTAVRGQQVMATKMLLQNKADPYQTNNKGETALAVAMTSNGPFKDKIVEFLLEAADSFVDSTEPPLIADSFVDSTEPVLIKAVRKVAQDKELGIIELINLLESKIDPQTRNKKGESAADIAQTLPMPYGPMVVDLLKSSKGEPAADSKSSKVKTGDEKCSPIVRCISGPKAKTFPLHQAIKTRSNQIVLHLILENQDVNQLDEADNSPMHVALLEKNTTAIDLLLLEKADLTITNRLKQTPLHIAVLTNELAIVRLIGNSSKAVLNTADAAGDTPLDLARKLGNEAISIYLTELNSSLSVMNGSELLPQIHSHPRLSPIQESPTNSSSLHPTSSDECFTELKSVTSKRDGIKPESPVQSDLFKLHQTQQPLKPGDRTTPPSQIPPPIRTDALPAAL